MENNFLSESDHDFDSKLDSKYREISKIHWTPEKVIDTSINWLSTYNAKHVLDIGSGVGKFCLIGAQKSSLEFTGVERRKSLFDEAQKMKFDLNLTTVNFINENITNVDFTKFDAIYYFNPFCEEVAISDWIEKDAIFSSQQYYSYQAYIFKELLKLKIGTKVVKYCSDDFELPHSYMLKEASFGGLLQLWVKEE
jgi:SAM-dependent methyltransferase